MDILLPEENAKVIAWGERSYNQYTASRNFLVKNRNYQLGLASHDGVAKADSKHTGKANTYCTVVCLETCHHHDCSCCYDSFTYLIGRPERITRESFLELWLTCRAWWNAEVTTVPWESSAVECQWWACDDWCQNPPRIYRGGSRHSSTYVLRLHPARPKTRHLGMTGVGDGRVYQYSSVTANQYQKIYYLLISCLIPYLCIW